MKNLKDRLIEYILNEEVDTFNETVETESVKDIDLSEGAFGGLNLPNINLSGFDLTGSDFSESNLESADLTDAALISVNFTGANLQYSNFNNSNLSGAILTGSNLTETDFSEVNFNGTDLRETDLSEADLSTSYNLSQAKFDKFTIWPDSINLPEDFDIDTSKTIDELEDFQDDLFTGEIEDN